MESNLPDWIKERDRDFSYHKPALSNNEIYEFLEDDPFESWLIAENFDATKQTIGNLVNYSMAMAMQHVAVSAYNDGISIHNIASNNGNHIKWETLFDDFIEKVDYGEPDLETLEDVSKTIKTFKNFIGQLEKISAKGE